MGDYVIAKYLRLSIEDSKSDSMSLENQHLLLDGHIGLLNLPNCRVLEFEDNGYSGTNFERPAVKELLSMVEAGEVNCIIVKDFSRFGRNSIEMGYFLERVFPLCRVRFIAVDDQYDSAEHDCDTGGTDVAFKLLIHEQYSRDLSRKIKSSVDERKRRGEYIHPFFGYRKVNGKLEIDELAAKTVRRIFELALEGKGSSQIAKILYVEGRRTPAAYKRGVEHCIWEKGTIIKVLQNEQYIGTYVAGKGKTLEVGSGRQVAIDSEDWIRIPDHHPAIVSKDTFADVQAMLNQRLEPSRKRKTESSSPASPLKGKIVCADCGHTMQLSIGDNPEYFCRYTMPAPDKPCHKLKVDAKTLEKQVLRLLKQKAADVEDDALEPLPTQRRAEISALGDEKCRLYERFVFGELSREDYKAATAKLTAEIEELTRTQAAIAEQVKKQASGMAFKQAAEILKGKRKLTAELATALVDRVLVYPNGEIEVKLNEK